MKLTFPWMTISSRCRPRKKGNDCILLTGTAGSALRQGSRRSRLERHPGGREANRSAEAAEPISRTAQQIEQANWTKTGASSDDISRITLECVHRSRACRRRSRLYRRDLPRHSRPLPPRRKMLPPPLNSAPRPQRFRMRQRNREGRYEEPGAIPLRLLSRQRR